MKSFAQVELHHCHQRDGLRPGSIADANDQMQFGELEVQAGLKSNDYEAFIASHDNWESAIRLHERRRDKSDERRRRRMT